MSEEMEQVKASHLAALIEQYRRDKTEREARDAADKAAKQLVYNESKVRAMFSAALLNTAISWDDDRSGFTLVYNTSRYHIRVTSDKNARLFTINGGKIISGSSAIDGNDAVIYEHLLEDYPFKEN